MKKGVLITIGIIVALLIIIGIVTLTNNKQKLVVEDNNIGEGQEQNTIIPEVAPEEEVLREEKTPTTPEPKDYEVNIKNFDFAPLTLTIKTGDSVTWTNNDNVAHTVTSDQGKELDSSLLTTKETYTHKFVTSGTYNYHCAPHPAMKGTIIVE